MEVKEDLGISSFRIVFAGQILQINYDTSFKEYQLLTINSVIQEVLNKIGSKPLQKTSDDYILYCSCGRMYNPDKLLSQAKCSHYTESDYNPEKNKNEKFLLCEKEKEEKYEKYLSTYEIETILIKETGAKKIKKLNGIIPNENKGNFPISDNLKNKIKELQTKKERGDKILAHSYSLKYNEQIYNELLLEFGIPNNKIKGALRISGNIKDEALLIATDATVNWDNKDYLYYENNEVLSNNEFINLCKEEIKKEFPTVDDEEEILNRAKIVIEKVTKNSFAINNSEDLNENESSEEENESSSDDIVVDSDSNLGSSSFNI